MSWRHCDKGKVCVTSDDSREERRKEKREGGRKIDRWRKRANIRLAKYRE
jgi:hypothetical protein